MHFLNTLLGRIPCQLSSSGTGAPRLVASIAKSTKHPLECKNAWRGAHCVTFKGFVDSGHTQEALLPLTLCDFYEAFG
eukprot:3354411-Amphidinium_carterae.1